MQFAFNDVGFPHGDLARDLDTVADAGYAGVEFALAEDGALTDPAFCREAQRVIETARASAADDGAERPLAGEPR